MRLTLQRFISSVKMFIQPVCVVKMLPDCVSGEMEQKHLKETSHPIQLATSADSKGIEISLPEISSAFPLDLHWRNKESEQACSEYDDIYTAITFLIFLKYYLPDNRLLGTIEIMPHLA